MSWRSGKSSSSVVPPMGQAILRPCAGIVVVALVAVLLANSMTKEVGRDEHMYCTAGALLARGMMLYRDFAYPAQLPCHPLLLGALYRALGTTHYLLVGRLISVTCDILVVLAILLIYRSVFGADRREGLLFGLAAATLYVFNPLVDYAAGFAWNHDAVILCVMLSLWLFFGTDRTHPPQYGRPAAMGALLMLATCMRVTTALVALLFLGALLLSARGTWKDKSRAIVPFSVAGLLVAAWPAWIVAQAPRAFYLNLVRIPALYANWLHDRGIVFDKAALTVGALRTPGYLVLLVLAGYLLWVARRHTLGLDVRDRPKAVLAALLPLAFLAIAYIPPTMWRQYLAVPVPFLVVSLAYPLAALRRRADEARGKGLYRIACYLMAIGTVVSVVAEPVVLRRSLAILVPGRWVPIALHRTSIEIAGTLEEPQRVLTLGPLHALEGGCDIYPELACGSIIYRAADGMSAQERRTTHTVGPETLAEMVRDRPPAAVLVGIEPSYFSFLEDPLRRVTPPDWPREIYGDRLQVYRPQ